MVGGGVDRRQPGGADSRASADFTEMEAVDSQACVRGVVQPPLLPPAAGGVRVHLASCDPCMTTKTSFMKIQQCFPKED